MTGLVLAASAGCSAPAVPADTSEAGATVVVAEAPPRIVRGTELRRLAGDTGRAGDRGRADTRGTLARRTEKLASLARPIRVGGTLLARPTAGRSGTGLRLGYLDPVEAPVGGPVDQSLAVSVANIPNRTSTAGFQQSMATLTRDQPDVLVLNEVSGRSDEALLATAPGYAAYRDPVVDRSVGGSQSMNNVVMWRTDRWNLVDAGRVKVVDDDRGYNRGEAFTWDRYLTWTVLQSPETGAVVPVVSLHMPTNPVYAPRQPGNPAQSRVQRYNDGMDRVLAVVRALQTHGPVLLGGDMNSHPTQGGWTAAAKMGSLGYGYAKDRGVMYLFHPGAAAVVDAREVPIASDHPALVTTIDLQGAGPVG